jgi:hypothetical protein
MTVSCLQLTIFLCRLVLLLLLQYFYWIKQNIIAGRPVLVGTRLRDSERAVDYDHIE